HEWVRQEDDIATIGITDYAQSEIQDIVFVELPDVGTQLTHKTEFGVIESVKAAFDLYSPVSGEVVEVNESLLDEPEQVNESPYEDGWFLKIKMTDPSELEALFDANQYQAHIEAEHA
ncbi:glycine cleavage system protein GcvH, partial [Candidatus Poribacteria bacterium]|nr:glycine cleavage system protein GcvH [Candidatus Poribacteria bacterium]